MTRMRSRSLVTAALVATVAATPAWSQTIVAGPTTTQLQAFVGDRITVPIAVDMTGAASFRLGAYRASLAWDLTQLRLVSTSSGTFGSAAFNTGPAADSGLIRFAAVNATGVDGIPVLGSATFEVIASDKGSAFSVQFQELTAATTYQNLLPFLTVTSGQLCAGLLFGDVDGNGLIQSLDAQ